MAWTLAAPLAQAGCLVIDPTPEGPYARTAPDGQVSVALSNGQWVTVRERATDSQKRVWALVADEATDEPLGWTRDDVVVCYDTSRSSPFRAPAPLGVFGVDMPEAGGLTATIAPALSQFATSRIGTQVVSSEYIVTTTPWFWTSSKLRLVPQHINFSSQTVNLSYGLTEEIALVAQAGVVEKHLDMLTFAGASGAQRLGESYSSTQGFTDAQAAVVARVFDDRINRVQVNLGLSLPTGETHADLTLLGPNGLYQTARAFYGMQPGAGTVDLLPGVVYAGTRGSWSWGLSYRGRFPLAANADGYRYGDLHEATAWGGYSWISGVTATLRLAFSTQGSIRGIDTQITGKAPAANPNFYGGQRADLFGGVTLNGRLVGVDSASLAVEAGAPFYQNLNGPQLSAAWQARLALRLKL